MQMVSLFRLMGWLYSLAQKLLPNQRSQTLTPCISRMDRRADLIKGPYSLGMTHMSLPSLDVPGAGVSEIFDVESESVRSSKAELAWSSTGSVPEVDLDDYQVIKISGHWLLLFLRNLFLGISAEKRTL